MIDGHGREIDYIRISVTDRCNLSCVYCMPRSGISFLKHEEILNFDEITRICKILAELGFRKVKLTGGEPLIRRDFTKLLSDIKKIPGIEKVTLTTNGILLKDMLRELVDAGLDAVNISLDTTDPAKFKEITGKDSLLQVQEGIREALKYPQIVTKINCVPILHDKENLIEMASLAKKYPIHVRFIEVMPVGQGKEFAAWNEDTMRKVLEEAYGKSSEVEEKLGNGPAHYYSFPGFQRKIGFISAVSHKFCGQCNRIRLTSDGYLKACLQYQIGADLKSVLRSGESDDAIKDIVKEVLENKPAGHNFFEKKTSPEEARIMAQIGG